MPHCAQARKRVRQSEKARVVNKSVRSEIKTLTKTLTSKIAEKDAAGAKDILTSVISKLDKAANNHVYHKNTAARIKSRITRMLSALSA